MKQKSVMKKIGLFFLLVFWGLSSFAQSRNLSGKVTDLNGITLPGVTVFVKGTTTGTITDTNGTYSLAIGQTARTLVFSYIGMKTQEVGIGAISTINIKLEAEVVSVDEVVVVGYGTQKRGEISGAVSTVKVKDLIAQPTSDLQGMLKGKVPGLYVTLNDARPGGSSNVLLRGIKSLKGGNSPLYIVDGVAISNINEININDVESISVLKDAASQSIYGARASNGVILITTLRGSNTNNKTKVSFQSYYSVQNVDPNFEIYSPEEYVQLRREAYRGDLATAANGWTGTAPNDDQMFNPNELSSIANKNFVNWTDYAFNKNVPIIKNDISISGGNGNTQYSASLGYFDQKGIRTGSDLTRYSGKLALDQKISNTVKIGLSAFYTTYNQGEETNTWQDFLTFTPIAKIYDDNGELVLYPTGDGKSVNPLYYDKTRNYEYKAERIILNGYLEITPAAVPGLKYKLNASMNSRHRETDYFRSFEDPGVLGKGYASASFYDTREYILENILTYTKTIADIHKLDITVMQGVEPRYNTSTGSTAIQLGNDFFGINSLNSYIASEVSRGSDQRKMISYMGRANYNLKDKYLFNFSVRYDGSSVFGDNNKWGSFPSGSFAWNLHKESFMNNMKWLNEAKLRLSYGQIGNQAISPYGSLATANNYFYVSGSTPVVGYLPGTSLPNPKLKWETTTTANGGIDFSLFNSRLSGSVDYYKSNTTDLLVDRQVPTVLGYSNIPANLGEIQNKGIEFALTGYIISKSDLAWSVSTNFSSNRNKLVKGVLQDPVSGKYIDDITNNWFIGQPVNVYYDYQFAGIWQMNDDIAHSAQPNARPGDVKVSDITGDGIINADDRTIIKRDPKWMGSITNNLSYKGFELGAEIYCVQGVVLQNPFMQEYNYGGRLDGILNGIKRDYWTPESPSNTMFRPHATSYSEYRGTIAYKDASYVRLRNISLSFNFPGKWLEYLGMSKVKVYVSGDNIWTKTKFLSYSPEALANNYPETKNYTFGININF
jgi:TonB-linked SusC/RagA family outer membrane protein